MGVRTSFAVPGSMRLTSVIGEFAPEIKTLEEAAANPLQRTKQAAPSRSCAKRALFALRRIGFDPMS